MTGFAFCGSFCTLSSALSVYERLSLEGVDLLPILSESVYGTDTRFFKAQDFIDRINALSKRQIVHTVKDAEPFGSIAPLDSLIIAPCTGNTLAKISHGITDSTVTMAAKAHLRCDRPTLIALCTNDAMSQNLANISALLTRKSVYFVPMRQDDPKGKPHSLVADYSSLLECYLAMLEGKQKRPLFLT